MNLKMTFLLIVLLGAGVGTLFWFKTRPTEEKAGPTLTFLDESLDPAKITRVEVTRGKDSKFVLERTGEEWSLPGKWPVREIELKQWLNALSTLRSRFVALPIDSDHSLKSYGLDGQPLKIKLTFADSTHTLTLGEEPSESNRFTRATFLRLDDKPEVVRLGSGLVSMLDRNQDYFLQRRIFPIERVAKDEDSKDKIEQLVASKIAVETESAKFTVAKKDGEWILRDAERKTGKDWQRVTSEDRLDSAKFKTLLTSFPDLWAEKFIETKDKNLADFGLKDPEYVLTVTRPSGAQSKLLIGKVASTKTRLVQMPAPPPKFGPPMKQPPQVVIDEYRFAKLEDNDRIFEVKAEKLGDIAVPLDNLRDPRLAHFKTDDVKRLEMQFGDQDLVLVKVKEKDKDLWRFEKPVKEDAEAKPVEEVLDKLASLQAKDKDILDDADLKAVGLDKPRATIKITLDEGKDDKKKTREIVFQFGTKDKEKDKAYVRVDPWPRVNQVSDEVWKLLQRPVLAYRNRRILDIASADLQKLEIHRADEDFTFEKQGTAWKLTAPAAGEVEASKIDGLVSELGKLEGVEFISEKPNAEDLDRRFGLTKPKLTVKISFKDAKKPPQTLAIGQRRGDKQDYFARLDQGPVFAVKKELRDDLDRSSLAYRPLQLWQLDRDAIGEITIRKDGPEFRLKKDGPRWKIQGPFDADAVGFEVDEMAEALAHLKVERFESHQTKDLAKFGLDKPALKISFTANKDKPRGLEIGKAVDNDSKNRFARITGQDAVVVLSDKTIAPFDRNAFDMLDKSLLSLNPRSIQRIRVQGTASFALEPIKEQWQVVDSPAATFLADEDATAGMLRNWELLRAEKIAAYGPKIDWANYGLDKPSVTLTVTMKTDDADKSKKPVQHVVELGKEAADGARYARVDKKDALVILDARTVEPMTRTYLDYFDPRVLKYDSEALVAIQRQMKDADLELLKQEDQWRLLKPAPRDADNLTVGDLLDKTFRLRAKRIAAYPVKDVKDLQPFGLDKPVAVVTLQLDMGGTMKKHVIKVGDLAKHTARKDTDERFAQIEGGPSVVVLSAELSRALVAPVLFFADRNLASFSGIDQVVLERGLRKAVFAKPDANWQMVQPIKADAEDAALDDLIRAVQRLRADEIVADKGADLKKYGLEQPLLQWRFKSGDSEKLHLIVGGSENDKPDARRYAKLADKTPVFLLSSKLSAKVQEEYRSRKPWAGLDAAQVERLSYTIGDKSFALKKKEGDWSVVGEPDMKVVVKKVTDTLDALAGLKVLHYVADTKADLQLFGLNNPSWKIEVQTPTGKRELWLGRTEGASQRFYATVPGSEAVFVIDEADSQRIARPLPSFVEAEKKK